MMLKKALMSLASGAVSCLEAQRDDVRRSGLAECKPGSRVRNVEVDALGRERLGFVLEVSSR